MALPPDPVEIVVPAPEPHDWWRYPRGPQDMTSHTHVDEQGFVHKCYHSCPSWLKIVAVSAGLNLFWEFVTFWPIHHFYSYMGWIH